MEKVCHKAGATSSDETSSTRAVVPYTLPEKSKNLALDQFLQLENGIPISSCSSGFQLFLKKGIGQF
jgi:hypothetical protein